MWYTFRLDRAQPDPHHDRPVGRFARFHLIAYPVHSLDGKLKGFANALYRSNNKRFRNHACGGGVLTLSVADCPRDKVDVILQRIGTPAIHCDGIKVHVCYSCGNAHYEFGDTCEKILARADALLYAKKAARSASPPKSLPQLSSSAPSIDPELSHREARTVELAWRRA